MSRILLLKLCLFILITISICTKTIAPVLVNAAQDKNIDGEILLMAIAPPPVNEGIISIYSLRSPNKPNQLNLPSTGYPISGAWSPDGHSFAFIMVTSASGSDTPPSDVDLYWFEKDNQKITRLTDTPDCPEIGLAWSSDSTWLYFGSFCREDPATEFWSINLLDGIQTRLGEAQWDATWAVWSPDLRYVALLAPRYSSDGSLYDEIVVVSPDGNFFSHIASDAHPGYQLQQITIASWSPDSTSINYTTRMQASETVLQNQLIQARLDGSDQKLIHTSETGAECINPHWASDGSYLAVICGGDLLIIKNDGSELRNLTNHQAAEYIEYFSWSPESNMIIFLTVYPDGDRKLRNFVIDENKEYPIGDIHVVQSFGLYWSPGVEDIPTTLSSATKSEPLEVSPEATEASPLQATDAIETSSNIKIAPVSLLWLLPVIFLVAGIMYYRLVRSHRLPGSGFIRSREAGQLSIPGQARTKLDPYQDAGDMLVVDHPRVDEEVQDNSATATRDRINKQNQLLDLGIQQIRGGHYQEGMSNLRDYIVIDPNNALAWLWLGWGASLNKDYRTAERCFLRAKRLGNVHAVEALIWLANQKPKPA